MKSSDFLASLYRDAVGWLVLWRSDTKASTWLNLANGGWRASVDACVEATHVRGEEHDLYFGVALQRERTAGRGDAAGVSVVPGMWADIDYGNKPNLSAAALKKNYPPPEVAAAVLGAMPALPTYVIATGGGLHAYWLFDKPFVIETEADRERIAGVLKSWQGMLRAKLLKAGGYGIDSTFDLPRVLRVPGSVHTKHPGLVVHSVSGDGSLQYSQEAVEGWLNRGVPLLPVDPNVRKAKQVEAVVEAVKPKPKKKPAPLQVSADADPPGSKLYNLMEASPEFRKLWEGKTIKASPSEYDMSLANYAINAGWSDADAAALLVAFCRKQQPSHMDKLLRVTNGEQDYLRLTVGKAHDRRASDAAADAADLAIDELAVEVREASRAGRDPDRLFVLEKVSRSLGVEVIGFQQVGRREEVYSLVVSDVGRKREVVIGPASAIHSSPQRMVERIMAELGRHIPVTPKLKKEWSAVVAGLVSIREFHELAEMELWSRVQVVVEEHLRRKSGGYYVMNADQRAACINEGNPYVEDKYLHLYGPSLRKLAAEVDKAIANSDLFIGLKTLGFRQETVSAGRSSRSYWKGSPEGFVVAAPPDLRPLVMGGRDG